MVIIIIYKSSSSTNPTPTPTPSANIQQLNYSLRAFDEPLVINNTNKPNGVDGYFPVTVNMNDFKFEPTIVSENNKTYVLSKMIKANGPLVPTPYPYYQVEPKEQITEGDLVLFQTAIKPELPSTDAVQAGTDANAEVISFGDFVEVTENITRTVAPGEYLICITKAEASTIVDFVYVQPDSSLSSGYSFAIDAPIVDTTSRYYKHIQPADPSISAPVPIGIRFIDTTNNNKLIYEIEDDAQEQDGVGLLKTMISSSVVNFNFDGMDVDPTQSINTKKEFKKN